MAPDSTQSPPTVAELEALRDAALACVRAGNQAWFALFARDVRRYHLVYCVRPYSVVDLAQSKLAELKPLRQQWKKQASPALRKFLRAANATRGRTTLGLWCMSAAESMTTTHELAGWSVEQFCKLVRGYFPADAAPGLPEDFRALVDKWAMTQAPDGSAVTAAIREECERAIAALPSAPKKRADGVYSTAIIWKGPPCKLTALEQRFRKFMDHRESAEVQELIGVSKGAVWRGFYDPSVPAKKRKQDERVSTLISRLNTKFSNHTPRIPWEFSIRRGIVTKEVWE